jgi:hypothetical protein
MGIRIIRIYDDIIYCIIYEVDISSSTSRSIVLE